MLEFFHALGIELAELWGMSETCGAGTCNRPGEVRIGTVGPANPGVELKIAEDGELLVRGGCVMTGYRNAPDKTAEALDPDGWLHTGDIGRLDADGFLTIVDRKKEIIINAAGKNMSPANIEARLKTASPLIGQAICIGDNKPYNTALIVLTSTSPRNGRRSTGLRPPNSRTSPTTLRSGPSSRPRSSRRTSTSPGSSRSRSSRSCRATGSPEATS